MIQEIKMSDKSKLKIAIENKRPGISDQVVNCPLFGGDIFLEQCFRIEQTIEEVYTLVLLDKVTSDQVTSEPFSVETQITPKLREYVKNILESSHGWAEAKRICTVCKSKPQGTGSWGYGDIGNPGLQPVNYTTHIHREK
jgi:hypothetical protein